MIDQILFILLVSKCKKTVIQKKVLIGKEDMLEIIQFTNRYKAN